MALAWRAGIFTLLLLAWIAPRVASAEPKHTGDLRVKSSSGLRVYVDDRFVGLTTDEEKGLRVRGLAPGEHRVRVEQTGFQPGRFVVVVKAGADVELKVEKLEVLRRIRRKPAEEPVDMTVGSPPMVIDDTDTPGPQNWEINLVFAGDLSADNDTYQSPLVDINYGLGEKTQFTYEVPYVFMRDVETDEAGNKMTSNAHGLGESRLGVKYRFYDNDETNFSLAVYPQVEFKSPGAKSKEDGGVAEEGTTWNLPLLLTKDLASASITANADVEKSTDDPHTHLFAGFGAGTRLTNKLAMLGEIASDNLESANEECVLLGLGLRLKINGRQALVGRLGLDLATGDGQRHQYVTLGYQRALGE